MAFAFARRLCRCLCPPSLAGGIAGCGLVGIYPLDRRGVEPQDTMSCKLRKNALSQNGYVLCTRFIVWQIDIANRKFVVGVGGAGGVWVLIRYRSRLREQC